MSDERIKISGSAIPVRGNDIDTDRIIPARYLKCVVFDGLGVHTFEDDRRQLSRRGEQHPLDQEQFWGANVLLVNKNFGCGSSREHAPQAIRRWGDGVQAIIGESFAEIFFGNCCALGMPCVVVSEESIAELMSCVEKEPTTVIDIDLESRTIQCSGCNKSFPLEISDGVRKAFLEGKWDATTELVNARDAVLQTASALPYFNSWQ